MAKSRYERREEEQLTMSNVIDIKLRGDVHYQARSYNHKLKIDHESNINHSEIDILILKTEGNV
jgi:hypothetical protein